jgi:chromosome segregation ATPase
VIPVGRTLRLAVATLLVAVACTPSEPDGLDDLRADVDELLAEREAADERFDELDVELEGLRDDLAAVDVADRLDEVATDLDTARQRLDAVEDDGSERDQAVDEVAEELARTGADLRGLVDELRGELDAVHGELDELRGLYEVLRERLDRCQRDGSC